MDMTLLNKILAALEAAVAAYNPAIGATVAAIVAVSEELAAEFKAVTGVDPTLADPAVWAQIVSNYTSASDALKQSFKDHPGV